MANNLDTDALETLIGEMSNYIDELQSNRSLIAEAADACDAVMGGDVLSQKYVSRIQEVLERIDQVAGIAGEIQQSLHAELRHAIDVVES